MVKKNRKRLSALLDDDAKPVEKVEEKKTEQGKPKTLKESLENDQEKGNKDFKGFLNFSLSNLIFHFG